MNTKNSVLNVTVSSYSNYHNILPQNLNLIDFLTDTEHDDDIQSLRQRPDKAERDSIKAKLPCITPSGVFSKRSQAGLIAHSGLIQFDIDAKDNPIYFEGVETLEAILSLCNEIKAELSKLPYVAYIALSASGRGLWGLILIAEPSEHNAHFAAIAEDFTEKGIKIDPAPSNVASLRGYSYDLDPYFNHSPEKYSRKVYPSSKGRKAKVNYLGEDEKVKFIVDQISSRGVDITGGYKVWFSLGCALANQFGEGGRCHFQDISRFHSGYDPAETDKQFDACLKGRGGINIGTFYKTAAKFGVLYKDALPGISEMTRVEAGAGPHSMLNVGQLPNQKESNTPEETKAIDNDLDIPDPDSESSLVIFRTDKGGHYQWKTPKSIKKISNFIIIPLYHLADSKEPKKVWLLINSRGEKAMICFPVRYLSRYTEFTALVEGQGNFVPSWNGSQFCEIKEYLFYLEKRAEEISTLGYQPGSKFFAFADCIFDGEKIVPADEFGIVEIGQTRYYLPAFSKVNEDAVKEFHAERKFRFVPGEAIFKEWANQFVTVFGDNGKIAICFVIAAIFRDLIFNQIKAFPILFLFGPPKTGKSMFRLALRRLFGQYEASDAIGLGGASTSKGFLRILGQIRNGLIGFEEYKNTIGAFLIEMFKNAFDGMGYERAQTTQDNRTHSTQVLSSIVIAGQEMPTKENALFSRVILLAFATRKYTDEQNLQFNQFEALIEKGLGNVLLEILKNQSLIETNFRATYEEVYAHLRKDKLTAGLDQRSLKNVASMLAPMKLLASVLEFPFDYAEAYRTFRTCIIKQNEQMSRSSEISQFWESVRYLISNGDLYKAYKIDGEAIFIHLETIHRKYYEHATKTGITPLDVLTLESYLLMQPEFIKPDGRNKHLVRFDLESKWCLKFDLSFFEKSFFG